MEHRVHQYKSQKWLLGNAKSKRLEQTNIIRKIKKDKTIHIKRMGRDGTNKTDGDNTSTHSLTKTVHDLPSLSSSILSAKSSCEYYTILRSIRFVLEDMDGNMHPFFSQGPHILDKIYECTSLGMHDHDSIMSVYESTRIIAIITSSSSYAPYIGMNSKFVNRVITHLIKSEYNPILYNVLQILSNILLCTETYHNLDDTRLGNCIYESMKTFIGRKGNVVRCLHDDDNSIRNGNLSDVLNIFGDVFYTIARMPFTCCELKSINKENIDYELHRQHDITDAKYNWCIKYIVPSIHYFFVYEHCINRPKEIILHPYCRDEINIHNECNYIARSVEFKVYMLETLYMIFRSNATRTNYILRLRYIVFVLNSMIRHTILCKTYKHYMIARSVLRVISCITYDGVDTNFLALFVRNNIIDSCIKICEFVICGDEKEDHKIHQLDKDASYGCKCVAFEIIENISNDDQFHTELLGIGKRTIFTMLTMWKQSLIKRNDNDVQNIATIIRNLLCMCIKNNPHLINLVVDNMVKESKLLTIIFETLSAVTKNGIRRELPVVTQCLVILNVIANNGYSREVCNDAMCEVLENLQFSCDKCSFDMINELLSFSHEDD